MKLKKSVSLFILLMVLCSVISVFGTDLQASAATELPYIKWLIPETTVASAKSISPAILTVKSNGTNRADGEFIATGDTITTPNGDYTAIVKGDLFGAGTITVQGYSALKRYALNTFSPSKLALEATDVSGDGTFSALDYAMAKRFCLDSYEFQALVNAKSIPVLLYHHMLPDADKASSGFVNNDITIATSEFTRHMGIIYNEGFTVVSTAQVVAYVRGEMLLPEKSVCLCFDDGYKSNTEYAAPILRYFKYKATVFSIMKPYFGEYQPVYKVSELQHITETDLANNSDVLVQQCHTWNNHGDPLTTLSYDALYTDFMTSQNAYKCDFFAYTYGQYNDTVIRAVKNAGFKAAFTTNPIPAAPGCEVFEIPRITITSPMTDSTFISKLKSGL